MRLVVCDDDVTLRGVVSKLAGDAGHSVLAETDSVTDAVDMVVRFGADVLILDLALPWGSGLLAVQELRDQASTCQIVVFTAYPADSPVVREAAVRAVIEKPDFEGLDRVLRELAAGGTADTPVGAERRKPMTERLTFPHPGRRSPSGLEDPESFADAVNHLDLGDSVLVVHLGGTDGTAGWFARLQAADQLLLAARALRISLRAQDRLSAEAPAPDARPCELVALLLAGGRAGVESLWARLDTAFRAGHGLGTLSGGWATCDEPGTGGLALQRARDAAHRSLGRPEGDRLWAG